MRKILGKKKGCLRTLFNLAINRQNSDYFP